MAASATNIVIPPPEHALVDPKTGKIDEVWLRVVQQLVTGANTASATYTFDALSPTTAEGDMSYYSSGTNVRLPIGTAGNYLKTNGADPSWQPLAGGMVAKAWAFVTYSAGTPTLQASFNIASISTTAGAGQLTFNLTTPFATTNWCAVGTAGTDNCYVNINGRTSSSVQFSFKSGPLNATTNPSAECSFIAFAT